MDRHESKAQSGEQRLKNRRRNFIRFVAIGVGVALIAGFATGVIVARGVSEFAPWIVVLATTLVLIGYAWFSVEYFRRTDELDLLDNLWASTVAVYFYIAALPAWFVLDDAGIAPPIDHWAIYGATFFVAIAAYAARRMGVRMNRSR